MIRTITPGDMKAMESKTIRETGITEEMLMQKAAGHVAEAVRRQLARRPGGVLVMAGPGNNGGDAVAALRMLCKDRPQRQGFLWLLEGDLSPGCQREFMRLTKQAPQVQVRRIPKEAPQGKLYGLRELPQDLACIVDGLFGTGLTREVTGAAEALCQLMLAAKHQGIPVVSVDIPSGLHGETGWPLGVAVSATETVTFHRPKDGLYLGQGPDCAGVVTVADIGIPFAYDDAPGFFVLEESDVGAWLPPRPKLSHKGTYGRVLVVAGSLGMAGAAALCATAALRTGAGLVTVACPQEIVSVVQSLCPCATCLPLPPELARSCPLLAAACEKADALAIGPGLGTGEFAQEVVAGLLAYLAHSQKPAVLDADALQILALQGKTKKSGLLSQNQILTPHPGEAAKLLGLDTEEIIQNTPEAARALQARYGASVVLKGATSVLISGREEALNILGTPAMAKGGSGDALTGALAALQANAAQRALSLTPMQILQLGTALHGLAGQAAAAKYGQRGLLATDLCQELGRVGGKQS